MTPANGSPCEAKATSPVRAQEERLISAYADARAVLVSASARVPADSPPPLGEEAGAANAVVARGIDLRSLWMWGGDSDRRQVRRKAGAAALGPGVIEGLLPYLHDEAAGLLETAAQAAEINLVDGFARPLVRDALMELFGIAPAARVALEMQVGAMAGFIPGNSHGGTTHYFALAATAKTLEEIWAEPLSPGAAASEILLAAIAREEISLDEALAQATLLLFGNSYTTLDALTGLLARLAELPEAWQAARSGSLPVAALVEESLRLGPPAHLILFREASREIACPGGVIPAGTRIVLPLDRLNRDPTCFDRADQFEPGRSGPPHLAFGAGRHMCVGLHLARALMRTAIEALLPRLPEWPDETDVDRAPGILGGDTVTALRIPAGAIRSC